MPRQNLTDLALPDRQYRVDLVSTANFETLADARKEDRIRAKMLQKYTDSPFSPPKCRAQQLTESLMDESADPSAASAVYMRDFRIRVVGHLWRNYELESEGPSTFTIWGRDMEIAGKDLFRVYPKDFQNAFKANLYRAGTKGATGYIFAFLEAEYGSDGDVWKFHWHGVADGELKDVLDGLRGTRKYGRPKDIRISRKPLTNLPVPLSYLIKPFWGSRWQGEIGGEKRRQSYPSRIKEPRHSELMLWLD